MRHTHACQYAAAIVLLLLACGSMVSCDFNSTPGQSSPDGRVAEGESIRIGTSYASVVTYLGHRGKHQFTVNCDGRVVTGRSFHFGSPANRLYFLFADGALAGVYKPPTFEYQIRASTRIAGAKENVRAPYDPFATACALLQIGSLSMDEVHAVMARRSDGGKEPENIAPAVGVVAPLLAARGPESIAQHERNETLKKTFDPSRAQIGMAPSDLDELYGEPASISAEDDEYQVREYAPQEPLELVAAEDRVSSIRVVLCGERVVGIFSNTFSYGSWSELCVVREE